MYIYIYIYIYYRYIDVYYRYHIDKQLLVVAVVNILIQYQWSN